jgi:hypothetical protein
VLHFMVPVYARGAAAVAAAAPSLREGLLALAVTALVVTLVAVMAVLLGRERPAERTELRKVA